MLTVAHPAALRGNPFPGADGGQRTDHRGQLTAPLDLDPQHREAGFLIVKSDPLDQTGEAVFGIGRGLQLAKFSASGRALQYSFAGWPVPPPFAFIPNSVSISTRIP